MIFQSIKLLLVFCFFAGSVLAQTNTLPQSSDISSDAYPTIPMIHAEDGTTTTPRQAFDQSLLPGFETTLQVLAGISNFSGYGFNPHTLDLRFRLRHEHKRFVVRSGFRYSPRDRKWFVPVEKGYSQTVDFEVTYRIMPHLELGGITDWSRYKNPFWDKGGWVAGPIARFPFVNKKGTILSEPGIAYLREIASTVSGVKPHGDTKQSAVKVDVQTMFKFRPHLAFLMNFGGSVSRYRQNDKQITSAGIFIAWGIAWGIQR